jgi:anti-sigma regulatory factor (Ser/Thr protein kinase)
MLPFGTNDYVRYRPSLPYHKLRAPTAIVPRVFSFVEAPDKLLKFIDKVNNAYKQNMLERYLFFNMRSVTQVDLTAICMLLSLLNKLKSRHINPFGNYPKDDNLKKFIINSGFLDIMKTNSESRKLLEKSEFNNHIYLIGRGFIKTNVIGSALRGVMKNLTKEERDFRPLYSILMEICANSVEHANTASCDKNWLVSVSYEDSKVVFRVADSGQGILETLRKKPMEHLWDFLTAKGRGEILKDVFDKHYLSNTGDINRHKGLPRIKEIYDRGYISSLAVLSNDVYLQFDTNSYTNLVCPYEGTFYTWEITLKNISCYDNKGKHA